MHHVIELTPENINDISIALNPDNLISLCHDCHTKITQGSTGDIQDVYIFDDEGNVVPAYPPRFDGIVTAAENRTPALPDTDRHA